MLLQGPIGYFFQDLANWLNEQGKTVYKLNFNAGDESYFPLAHAYRDTHRAFPDFLADYLNKHRIQAIVCFGDTRPYHLEAKKIAQAAGIDFWAFEEGYFRPHYITLERNGVNAYSDLPRSADFYLKEASQISAPNLPLSVPSGFWPTAKLAIRYYWLVNIRRQAYPHYIHHRDLSFSHYLHLWSLSGLRRLNYWYRDRHFAKKVQNGHFGRFYILPLQVFNDSQVLVHSDFSSVRSFLEHVLTSFAIHAPSDTNLIVKHHPMDRGFIDYQTTIQHFLATYPSLKGRIHYIHDVPLPVLLRHGVGMVTLNSTSGLSALIHNMPVKTLGRAAYDIEGITCQKPLNEFWHHPSAPNRQAFHAYRIYHLHTTQINGSFYSYVNFPKPLKSEASARPKVPNIQTMIASNKHF